MRKEKLEELKYYIEELKTIEKTKEERLANFIKGEVYKQTSNVADAKTSNLSQNGQRVAVTIQAFSKEGNYDSGSYKRDDCGRRVRWMKGQGRR